MTAGGDLFLPSLGMTVGTVIGCRPDGGRRHSVSHAASGAVAGHQKCRGELPKFARSNAVLGAGSKARRGSVAAECTLHLEEVPDLGVLHTARMKTDCQLASKSLESQTAEVMSAAVEDYVALETAALEAMAPHILKLPQKSVLVEVGSRYGEFTTMAADRFPQHQVQPTEGTGQTAPGLLLLLQERVMQHNREHPVRAHVEHGGGRLMPPRHLDADRSSSWASDLGRTDVGCVFAINVLHFVREFTVELVLKGCRQVLRPGGMVFFCGPFFNDGEISEANLACHGVLQSFSCSVSGDQMREPIHWGLHDLQHLREHAENIGLEFVEQRRVGGEWDALVLRQPTHSDGPRRRRSSAASSNGGNYGSSSARRPGKL